MAHHAPGRRNPEAQHRSPVRFTHKGVEAIPSSSWRQTDKKSYATWRGIEGEVRHQSRRMSSIEAVESPNSRPQPLSEPKPLIDSMRNFLAKGLCGLACADGCFLMAPDCRGPNAEDVFYWGFVLRPELLKAL